MSKKAEVTMECLRHGIDNATNGWFVRMDADSAQGALNDIAEASAAYYAQNYALTENAVQGITMFFYKSAVEYYNYYNEQEGE